MIVQFEMYKSKHKKLPPANSKSKVYIENDGTDEAIRSPMIMQMSSDSQLYSLQSEGSYKYYPVESRKNPDESPFPFLPQVSGKD